MMFIRQVIAAVFGEFFDYLEDFHTSQKLNLLSHHILILFQLRYVTRDKSSK